MSEMAEVSVNDLEGAALDWAVAKAVGEGVAVSRTYPNGSRDVVTFYEETPAGIDGRSFSPSRHWGDGGPLIDKHIAVLVDVLGEWYAEACEGQYGKPLEGFDGKGPTALIAAMRAIVSSELGDTVKVPAELAGEIA